MLIVNIAFMALSGMQVTGLRQNHSAYLATQVLQRLDDMADRMRSNLQGVTDGNYRALTAPVSNPGCVATGCTAAQMATTDYFVWRQSLDALLPSGAGVVCLDSTPNDGTPGAPECDNLGATYAIKVWWDDDRSGVLKRQTMGLQP